MNLGNKEFIFSIQTFSYCLLSLKENVLGVCKCMIILDIF